MELEHVLGVRLLDRTTRRVRPTEAGLAYYERCLDILARVEETEMQVSRLHGEPAGVLRLNGPASFGALYLAPAVADVHGRIPEAQDRADADRPLHRSDRRGRRRHDPDRGTRGFEPDRPKARAGPARLRRLSLLCREPRRAGRARGSRASRLPDLRPHDHAAALADRARRRGRPASRSIPSSARTAATFSARPRCRGRGVAFLPTFLVGRDIEAGAPRGRSSTAFRSRRSAVHALYASNRYLAAKTRAFVDFLAEALRRRAGMGPVSPVVGLSRLAAPLCSQFSWTAKILA